jgi:uncharacterized protein
MIFVDTGAFLARYLERDAHHRTAIGTWKKLSSARLLTSNHVLDETFTLLARRAGYAFAADRADRIYASVSFEIVGTTREHEQSAITLFRRFADQEVSFTDCLSFAIMKDYDVRTAFSFDHHFRSAGFQVIGLR